MTLAAYTYADAISDSVFMVAAAAVAIAYLFRRKK